jgi:putative Mn2+ efflux pump MntP
VNGHAWRDYGRYGTVGIELIVTMALGYYGGRYLDARIGGHGWVTFVGFGLGVIVGFRAIFAAARHMQRDIERAEKADREERTPDDDGKPEP